MASQNPRHITMNEVSITTGTESNVSQLTATTAGASGPRPSNDAGGPYHYIPTPRSYTAEHWNHFKMLDPKFHPPKSIGDKYAHCNYCPTVINHGRGTAGLKNHMNSHEKNVEEARRMMATLRRRKRTMYTGIGATVKKTAAERQQEILEATACWIVEENIPLNIVEKKSFRRMCKTIDPSAPTFSQPAIREEIKHLGDICKEAVKKELHGRHFCLTTDHWTSMNNETYGALTAHYIIDQDLKRCVLHFEVHHGTTKGDALFENLLNVFQSYEFDVSFITSVTTDTTGNMNTFGRRLEEKGVIHLYCIDHNLHLNAKIAFDDSNLPDSGNAMKAARSQVEFFNSSTQALDKLYNMQNTTRQGEKALKLLQDVKTRWWSTWNMLNRLLLLTPTIEAALIASGQVNTNALSPSQKQILQEVEALLAPMAKAQKRLEGDKYPTISSVPFLVWKLRENLKLRVTASDNNLSSATRHLAQKMYTDFVQHRYGDGTTVFHDNYVLGNLQRYISLHKIVLVATFLDPRFKFLTPFIPDADKPRIHSYVLSLMLDVTGRKTSDVMDIEIYNNHANLPAALLEEQDSLFAELGARNVQPADSSTVDVDDTFMVCNAELERYKLTPQIASNRDPLLWWHENALKYPILEVLARRYLAIPATSAPSERLWSVASLIITKTRTQLAGHVVADMIFLKENTHLLKKHAQGIEGRVRILPNIYDDDTMSEARNDASSKGTIE